MVANRGGRNGAGGKGVRGKKGGGAGDDAGRRVGKSGGDNDSDSDSELDVDGADVVDNDSEVEFALFGRRTSGTLAATGTVGGHSTPSSSQGMVRRVLSDCHTCHGV
jgi:hypothetical protein